MNAGTYEDLHSPQFHRNLEEFASEANIPVEYITQSAAGKVPEKVADWLLNFPKKTSAVINLGATPWDENVVAFHMAGMLTRNLLRAKVLSMSQLFEAIEARKVADPTCLILPGFHGTTVVEIPKWRQTMIIEALSEREMLGKRSVVMIRNKANLATVFGSALVELLQLKFEMVNV